VWKWNDQGHDLYEVWGNNLSAGIQADWPGTAPGGKQGELPRHMRELRAGWVMSQWRAVYDVPESGVAAAGPEDREGKRGMVCAAEGGGS